MQAGIRRASHGQGHWLDPRTSTLPYMTKLTHPTCAAPALPQGTHSLVCSATYVTPDGERRVQGQAFSFTAANPLVVRTKVCINASLTAVGTPSMSQQVQQRSCRWLGCHKACELCMPISGHPPCTPLACLPTLPAHPARWCRSNAQWAMPCCWKPAWRMPPGRPCCWMPSPSSPRRPGLLSASAAAARPRCRPRPKPPAAVQQRKLGP